MIFVILYIYDEPAPTFEPLAQSTFKQNSISPRPTEWLPRSSRGL